MGRANTWKDKDGRTWSSARIHKVWVCLETGDVLVDGIPGDVEPDDCPEDDPRAHNCDAAGCSSVTHVIARGRIAGRASEAADEHQRLADAATEYLEAIGALDEAKVHDLPTELRRLARLARLARHGARGEGGEITHVRIGTNPYDPPVSFQCPVCGSGWGAETRPSLEPAITLAEGYASSTAILDRIAKKLEGDDQLEIVFLPGETDDGESERVVEGVRYVFERAWLFGCPLCRGELALALGYWRRD